MREATRLIERTCCACRSKSDKRSLARLVSVEGRLVWDDEQRLPGRGGYVHLSPQCVSKIGQAGRWEKILHLEPGSLSATQVSEVARALATYVNSKVGADSPEKECEKRGGSAKKVRL